jgi:hypothetical protein
VDDFRPSALALWIIGAALFVALVLWAFPATAG